MASSGSQQPRYMVVSMSRADTRAYLGDQFDENQMVYTDPGRPLPASAQIQDVSYHNRRRTRASRAQPQETYDMITQGRHPSRFDEELYAASRTAGAFANLTDRGLIETRQAQALARLDTSILDAEIARRVLGTPRAWGWVGTQMIMRGWIDDMETVRRLSHVEHFADLPYLRHSSIGSRSWRARALPHGW